MANKKTVTPDVLEGATLRLAPQNELGVVFLFAELARRWRMRVDQIASGFPDCIAYQKSHGGEKRLRIEFEFKSRNFLQHGHDHRKCDCLVCWEDNWPTAPKRLRIIELRREFGLGFNVWLVPSRASWRETLDAESRVNWSAPQGAHKGDLILFYLSSPESSITHVFSVSERVSRVKRAQWSSKPDYMGDIRKICKLSAPIFLSDLQSHKVLATAGFVRACLRARCNATEYWPYLYDMIVKRNPGLRRKLSSYEPARLK